MEQKSLIIKDLFKKLDTVKGEHPKVEHQCHEDREKLWREERKLEELIRQNACAVVVDASAGLSGPPNQWWLDDYNKKVSGLRASIEKNEGIRKIIGKIPIEDVAFVKINDEQVRDRDYEDKKTDLYYDPIRLISPYMNRWILDISYFHVGPGSPAKVFFREGENGHYYICGVLLNEPSKTRKGHTKESQKKPS